MESERFSDPTALVAPSNAITFLCMGLRDAEVSLVSNHPGFRSNEVAAAFHGPNLVTSANERTAFAVAWGHAIGGRRAAAAFKNVGLNDAADPFINALQLDVNAGLVVLVFDDTDLEHSQLRMDSRHYFPFGGIWLEPYTLREAAGFCAMAFDVSEELCVPVVLRVPNALLSRGGSRVVSGERAASRPAGLTMRNPIAWVAHPTNASQRAAVLEHRRAEILDWCEGFSRGMNPEAAPNSIHHFVFGSAGPANPPELTEIARLPCLPLPHRFIRECAARGTPLKVTEHGDPIVAHAVQAALNPLPIIAEARGSLHPNRSYHCRDEFAPIYAFLRALPSPFVVGDLGGHLMDPQRSVDACLCYGASVAVATGVSLARPEATVSCVCGDGAFLHSGKVAICEALARRARILVVIIDNGGCRGTGGQRAPGSLLVDTPEAPELSAPYSLESPGRAIAALQKLAAMSEPVRILHLQSDC